VSSAAEAGRKVGWPAAGGPLFRPDAAAERDEEAAATGTWTARLHPGHGPVFPAMLSFTWSWAPQ
jgi:hypothetical protein